MGAKFLPQNPLKASMKHQEHFIRKESITSYTKKAEKWFKSGSKKRKQNGHKNTTLKNTFVFKVVADTHHKYAKQNRYKILAKNRGYFL